MGSRDMNQDAIDRLCERINATAGGADCLLERDVRAALEGERERAERIRRAHLTPYSEGWTACKLCLQAHRNGGAETHSPGCLASPEGPP